MILILHLICEQIVSPKQSKHLIDFNKTLLMQFVSAKDVINYDQSDGSVGQCEQQNSVGGYPSRLFTKLFLTK